MKFFIVVMTALGFSSIAFAQDASPTPTFISLGAGIADTQYGAEASQNIDDVKNRGATNDIAGTLELPFIYFWNKNNRLQGLGFRVFTQEYSHNYERQDYLHVQVYEFAYSYLQFFGRDAESGFFARGDLGYGHLRMMSASALGQDEKSRDGMTMQLGSGYSFKLNSEQRFLTGISYFYDGFGSDSIRGLIMTMNYLL